MSADWIPDVIYSGGWSVGGLDSGCDISGWNEGGMSCDSRSGGMNCDSRPSGMSCDSRPGGMRYAMRRKGGGLRDQERGSHVAIFGEDPTCLTPRKPVLHSLYQVPTFLGMRMVSISENTKVKKWEET